MDGLSARLELTLANRLTTAHRRQVLSISLAGSFLAIVGGGLVMLIWRLSQRGDVLIGELDQTRQSERSLTTRVRKGVVERQKAEETLRNTEEKMTALQQLAGGIAHDFNNLLCAISGFNSMAMDDLPPDHPVTDHLQEIRKAAARAAARAEDLTSQLLAFGQRQNLKKAVLDLNELVAEMESVMHRMMGNAIQLRSIRGTDAVRVFADPEQLKKVVLNLALNARDAMPTGGEVRIETSCSGANSAISRLTVSDTGAGIDTVTQAQLFAPFFKGLGKGLGLSMVHGIVKQSGGDISVDSKVGRGTTFTVTFPAVLDTGTKPAKADSDAVMGGVLVVDDEEQVRRLAGEYLRRKGFNVLEAENGAAALEQLHQRGREIALLLTDVIMPGMSGTELMRQARLRQPALRVVLMSGYTENQMNDEDLASASFVQKPFSPGSLHAAVRAALGLDGAEVCMPNRPCS
jgi:signal transduction histidine kinase/CheY-like chemotaxis protein